jgi:hypothetical protein
VESARTRRPACCATSLRKDARVTMRRTAAVIDRATDIALRLRTSLHRDLRRQTLALGQRQPSRETKAPCYAVSTVACADEKATPLGRDLNENLSSAVAVAATEEKHDQEDDDYPTPDRHRPFLLSFRFVAERRLPRI